AVPAPAEARRRGARRAAGGTEGSGRDLRAEARHVRDRRNADQGGRIMDAAPIDSITGTAVPPSSQTTEATDAFGLGFESLLQIVLTQLTYQDPLKPMENFEFVSRLAQFSQIQQTQDMARSLETLVSAQATAQAASLLGKEVDI